MSFTSSEMRVTLMAVKWINQMLKKVIS